MQLLTPIGRKLLEEVIDSSSGSSPDTDSDLGILIAFSEKAKSCLFDPANLSSRLQEILANRTEPVKD